MGALSTLLVCGVLGAMTAVGVDAQSPQPAPVAPATAVPSGVQWFTELRAGLEEARRTGRPVMLLAAAPSCGGVSGMW